MTEHVVFCIGHYIHFKTMSFPFNNLSFPFNCVLYFPHNYLMGKEKCVDYTLHFESIYFAGISFIQDAGAIKLSDIWSFRKG